MTKQLEDDLCDPYSHKGCARVTCTVREKEGVRVIWIGGKVSSEVVETCSFRMRKHTVHSDPSGPLTCTIATESTFILHPFKGKNQIKYSYQNRARTPKRSGSSSSLPHSVRLHLKARGHRHCPVRVRLITNLVIALELL